MTRPEAKGPIFWQVMRDKKGKTWFCCPTCRGVGEIDEDQLNGRVSIVCPCGYHETKDWSKELKL